MRLWDPRVPDDPGRVLGRHDGGVWAVAVTAEGEIVSGGGDGVVRLWDPRAPNDPGRELGRHDDLVWAVAVIRRGGDRLRRRPRGRAAVRPARA